MFLGDLRHARFVLDHHILFIDFDVGIGIASAFGIENQGVADHAALASGRILVDFHQPAVAGPSSGLGDTF